MNTIIKPMLAEPSLIALGGGEIIMIILSLMVFLAVTAGIVALVLLLVRHFQKSARSSQSVPPLQGSPVAAKTRVLNRTCPQCGAGLQPDLPEGLCPACLLQHGIATEGGAPPGTPPFVPPTMPELAKLFPQLEILELVGQGGMGAVYKARQPALDRLVALKILAPRSGGDVDFAGRFNREARALARLSHPNIVGVYDFGEKSGHRPDATTLHYFIMEYVDGPNLRQAGKLSPRQAMEIIPQICAALQFAHDEGIVHRDIKPENVLLDKKGRVKIADFGLAKILGQEPQAVRLTGAKDIMGTPHYMAPEQVERPQDVDHRADIYSLGVVFYEMLTGELPLGKFQAPSQKVQMDVRLDEVVLRSLAKEPELRYQHVSEVGTRVETIAHSEGTTETATATAQFYPTGWEYRSTKTLWGWPLLHVTEGMDPKTGKVYVSRGIFAIGGIARGLFAFGGRAYGGFAFGGIAAGLFAFGGVAIGGIAFGGVALGLLLALGGLAVGVATLGSPGFGFYRVQDMMPFLSIPHFVPVFAVLLLVSILVPLIVQSWAKTQVQKNSGPRGTPPVFPDEGAGSKSLRRGLKVAAWTFFTCLMAAAVVTALQPNTYLASARVQVNDVRAQDSNSLQTDPYYLQTEFEVMQSAPVLEKAAVAAHLKERWSKKYNGGAVMGDDAMMVLMRQMLQMHVVRNTALVDIDFYSDSPAEAAELANRIAEAYCSGVSGHGGAIVDRAVVPLHPVRPNIPLNMVIGAVAGVLLGLLVGSLVAIVSFLKTPRPRNDSGKPDWFWRKFAVVVLALISIPMVIAILGMLAAMAIPAFVKARNRAQAVAAHNQRALTESNSASRFDHVGQTWFPKGDSIEILSVERSENEMKVKGLYNLISANNARLALYVTSTNDIATSEADTQSTLIALGTGDFELVYPHRVSGLPHVTMYSADGKGFAEIYFGSKDEALEESRLDLGRTNAPPASAETWSPEFAPNEKPDLQKIVDDARDLMSKGRYEESLQRILWHFNHAQEFGDNWQNAVRVTSLLSTWEELGRRYPKAKQALLEIRDEKTRALTTGNGYVEMFQDVKAINHELDNDDATDALFKTICERDPKLSRQAYPYVEDLLMARGDYAFCLGFIGDPQANFESARRSLESQRENRQRMDEIRKRFPAPATILPTGYHPPDMGQMATNQFVGQVHKLVEILVGANRKAEAEKIQDQAVAALDDPQLKSAMSDAEQKIAERAGNSPKPPE